MRFPAVRTHRFCAIVVAVLLAALAAAAAAPAQVGFTRMVGKGTVTGDTGTGRPCDR